MIAVRLLAVLLLAAGLLYLVLAPGTAAHLDARLMWAILAAQPALAIAVVLIGWRFRLAVGRADVGLRACLSASLLGQASDLVLPWRLSEFVRIVHLRDRARVPLSAGLAAALVERIADLVMLAALAVLAASLALVDTGIGAILSVAACALLVLFALPRLAPALERIIPFLPFALLRRTANGLLSELVARMRDGTFWRVLAPTALAWIFAALGTWAFFAVADPHGAAPASAEAMLQLSLTTFVATTLGNVVAVLPASIGTYEAAVVIVLRAYGIPFEQALAVGIALHLAQLLIGVLGGALVAAFDPLRMKDLIREAREAAAR